MVDALVRECESKHGEIEIAPASGYLVGERPELLDELFVQSKISSLLGVRLSPTAAALDPSTRVEELVDALSGCGYMPNITAEESDEVQQLDGVGGSGIVTVGGVLRNRGKDVRRQVGSAA